LIYGRKGEKVDKCESDEWYVPFLIASFEAEEEVAKELEEEKELFREGVKPKRREKERSGRKPIVGKIEHEKIEIPPREVDRICRKCGCEKVKIGEETTQELELIPAQLTVREYVRGKYACKHCRNGVTMPELPPRPIEKGRPGPGLLAHIAVSKYGDHIPLYRQERIFARHGVELSRSTLCDWVGTIGSLLEGIVKEMKRYILKSPVVQSDDTYLEYRDEARGRKTRRGYLWAYGIAHGEVVYDFREGRARDGPVEFFRDYSGYIQTDGYSAYNILFESRAAIC
jgi:transposase